MAKERRTILVIDDEPAHRQLLGGFVESLGFKVIVAASAEQGLEMIERERPEMVVLDVRLPGMSGIDALVEIRRTAGALPVLLITAHADLRQAVDAMKGGADDYLAKPIDLDELSAAIEDAIGPAQKSQRPPSDLPSDLPDGIVCESPPMQHVVQTVAVVAPSNAPVLITGESGTGKEVVAQLIHRWSRRSGGPLVIANCGGLPESLIESELFGHVKGAFTGAAAPRQGFFRSAHGGTLFLDEIGELPIHLQPKLLRALESGQISPVGSDAAIDVDVRLVAATNRDAETAIQEGQLRHDLYYRINVVELHVPPLRDRLEDIVPLARRFASEFSGGPVRLSPQAVQNLLLHNWPGNVRQLRNAIQRACLLCRGDVILPEHFPASIGKSGDDGRVNGKRPRTAVASRAGHDPGDPTRMQRKPHSSRGETRHQPPRADL